MVDKGPCVVALKTRIQRNPVVFYGHGWVDGLTGKTRTGRLKPIEDG